MRSSKMQITENGITGFSDFAGGIEVLLEAARRTSARSVNAVMTATYWEIGRRIVEFEQGGEKRARYGKKLLKNLSAKLTKRFGKGFSQDNLERFRLFYLRFSQDLISETVSRKLPEISLTQAEEEDSATPLRNSEKSGHIIDIAGLAEAFPLPWSHYVQLIRLHSDEAIRFYHTEALRGGWSVRQLKRQIDTQFYERTALSKNKAGMLQKGREARQDEIISPEEELKDPLVLEFLGLKDEYSENDLEEALIKHLEIFLLELGGDFAFVGRQRRLRIDDEWYRVDLLFFIGGCAAWSLST